MMKHLLSRLRPMKVLPGFACAIGVCALGLFAARAGLGQRRDVKAKKWRVGVPIVTYYAGPAMTEAVAKQMADGGFNVVWCGADQLDLIHRFRLLGMVHDSLLTPLSLDSPEQRGKLDAMIEKVKTHPAFYSYYLIDEPAAGTFPGLGRLTAYIRERDPAHMPYINLFPTYATNEQLGTTGDVVTAYKEYLRQFITTVNPMLLSWDNYQFLKGRDGTEYFLNLALMRQASLDTGIPFLNIVQASSWDPAGVRVPVPDEMRYLVYTTAAYGAQGISYYVYYAPGHEGMLATADGTPTPLYDAVKPLNREFAAIVTELQPFKSLGAYHTSMKEAGCEPLPEGAVFRLDPTTPSSARGLLLGTFGKGNSPSHVLVVNLDYKAAAQVKVLGPRRFEVFDATTRKWSRAAGKAADLSLPPGGGKLLRSSR